jgi:hypothetical protein
MTVWIYVDTTKQVSDKDHLKVFATKVAAEIEARASSNIGRPAGGTQAEGLPRLSS